MVHASLLEAVGAGLGVPEMFGAMLAAKRVGEDPALGVASIRFFGKFLGTHGDYFVLEATLKEAPEEEPLPAGEEAWPRTATRCHTCVLPYVHAGCGLYIVMCLCSACCSCAHEYTCTPPLLCALASMLQFLTSALT